MAIRKGWVHLTRCDSNCRKPHTIPLHWHPDTERLTVLTGVVLFGAGDKMDPVKTTALGPGSYIVILAMVPTLGNGAGLTIFQVSGLGPYSG